MQSTKVILSLNHLLAQNPGWQPLREPTFPGFWETWGWPLALAGALAAGGIAWWLARRNVPAAPPRDDPVARARRLLQDLSLENPPAAAQVLSEEIRAVLRAIVEDLPAGLTTDELLAALRQAHLPQDISQLPHKILPACDTLRFAGPSAVTAFPARQYRDEVLLWLDQLPREQADLDAEPEPAEGSLEHQMLNLGANEPPASDLR